MWALTAAPRRRKNENRLSRVANKMNWRRGLCRIWVVGSVTWMLLAGLVTDLPHATKTYWDFRHLPTHTAADARAAYARDSSKAEAMTDQYAPVLKELGRRLTMADQRSVTFLWVGVAPPLIALVIGLGLTWAFEGFRRDPAPKV
jgi:hypothetical protein